MGDQQQGAVEVEQQLLEQLQGLDVQVVGRLVEHQHVGRLGEQLGQQQAVGLPARERLDRLADPLRGEEEVLQVAHHVSVAAAHRDPVAALGHVVVDALLGLEPAAQLVEVGHLQLGPELHLALGGRELAQQDLEQGCLAGAVAADQTDAVAALDLQGEVADHRLVAEALGDMLQGHHPLAAALAAVHAEAGLALALAPLAALAPQLLQRPHPPLVAGAPRLDALTDPRLLLGQLLVELGVLAGLHLQLVALLGLVPGVVAGIAAEASAVELEDGRGQLRQEGAVVGDEQHGAVEGGQLLLEPGNGVEVQVVGGLVEQQQVRLGHQRPGQRHAPPPAPGERSHLGVLGQPQAGQHHVDALVEGPAVDRLEARLQLGHAAHVGLVLVDQVVVLGEQLARLGQALGHHVEDGLAGGLGEILGEHADLQTRSAPDAAAVGQDLGGDQLEQRRLAGAVAPHQGQALALLQHQVGAVEQHMGTIGQLQLFQT